MEHTYASHKQAENAVPEKEAAQLQGPSMEALRSGAAMPTPGQKGRQVSLPDAMRAKMENAFGADLSAVKLYESQAVADAGANAITQGSEIAFAPGMMDFSSRSGQARLGHEISHVVSQARGEVTGGGFLNDHALESRADREGAMAAAGQQIAMPTAALSPVTAAAAAGPMQAEGKDKDEEDIAGKTGGFVILPQGQPDTEGGQDPRGSLAFPEMDNDSFNFKTMNWQMQSVSQHLQDHEQKINTLQNQVAQMQSSFQTQMNGPAMGMGMMGGMDMMSMMGMMGMGGMDMGMMGMAPQQGGSPPAVDDEIKQAMQGAAQTEAAATAQANGTVAPMPMRANDEEYAGDIDSLAQTTEKFDAQPLSQTTNPRRRRSSVIGRGRSGSIS